MKSALVALTLIVGSIMGGTYVLDKVFVDGLPAAVVLSGTTSVDLTDAIFRYYKQEVGLDRDYAFIPGEYKIRSQYIDMNNDSKKDLIVVFESNYTCGTGGCLASIFTQTEAKRFAPMQKFSYAVKEIKALETFTNGMRDIRMNEDAASIMIWNGTSYVILESI